MKYDLLESVDIDFGLAAVCAISQQTEGTLSESPPGTIPEQSVLQSYWFNLTKISNLSGLSILEMSATSALVLFYRVLPRLAQQPLPSQIGVTFQNPYIKGKNNLF